MLLMPPETAHRIAIHLFKRSLIWRSLSCRFQVTDARLEISSGAVRLSNPVGLAAGFDKNCEMFESLFSFGFGYLTLGTITMNPREGNPKPRIWRYPEGSLANSMGLPNEGARKVRERLSKTRQVQKTGPLILSISGLSLEEFTDCYLELEQNCDAIELNISTPNTAGVRIFQEPSMFERLLDEIMRRRQDRERPIWVKIPPYFDEKEREKVLELVEMCLKKSVNGITAINTKPIRDTRSSIGTAGLSGKAIFDDMLRIVTDIYAHTAGKIAINAVGGIYSGSGAWKAIRAGATSIQLYTGFVYQGPGVVATINQELLRLLEDAQYMSVREAVGTAV